MKTKTLFNAYKEAKAQIALIERIHGAWGIAVGDSDESRRWIRLDRLTRRIDARFNGRKVCSLCACGDGAHYSSCRRYEKPVLDDDAYDLGEPESHGRMCPDCGAELREAVGIVFCQSCDYRELW